MTWVLRWEKVKVGVKLVGSIKAAAEELEGRLRKRNWVRERFGVCGREIGGLGEVWIPSPVPERGIDIELIRQPMISSKV